MALDSYHKLALVMSIFICLIADTWDGHVIYEDRDKGHSPNLLASGNLCVSREVLLAEDTPRPHGDQDRCAFIVAAAMLLEKVGPTRIPARGSMVNESLQDHNICGQQHTKAYTHCEVP